MTHPHKPRSGTMLATTLEADPFLGRILTGRIRSGSIKPNQTIKALARDGRLIETARVTCGSWAMRAAWSLAACAEGARISIV